jgi:hypothetical protein
MHPVMTRHLVAAAAATAALGMVGLLATPATAPARALFAIGDQKPSTFADARLRFLRVRNARVVIPWDALDSPDQTAAVDTWMAAARTAHMRPLVAFDDSLRTPRRLPTPARFLAAFAAFRARYPFVRDYSPWNEANQTNKAISRRPQLAARYYNAMRSDCPTCNVTAADLLDVANMIGWVRSFRTVAHEPRLWGLHNYLDVNHHTYGRTRVFLAAVPGQLWLTEVGGVVWRKDRYGRFLVPGVRRASAATAWLLSIADRSPRITRVYYYHWRSAASLATAHRFRGYSWDSGLIAPSGRARPAFAVVARWLGLDPSDAPSGPPPGTAEPPAVSAPPAPSPPETGLNSCQIADLLLNRRAETPAGCG